MSKNIVIVESPAKAKTIEKFLGKDFHVVSSFGHIRDLKKKDISIDFENNYNPIYEVPVDKKKLVSELKKKAAAAETVWLASDEDREGEAIAWHLYEELALTQENTKRIVFHEITKNAILEAIETPRSIDLALVDAQQARRVLDRIVGFELSPILWRKIKPSLSAGRVQSVAVRLIVEREREINNFTAEANFRVTAIFITKDTHGNTIELPAELPKRFKTKKEAQAFLETCKDALFTIEDISKKPSKKTPAAPFTTSTLQQEAARKLGYSVSQTMMLAQKLYENGFITYMRTDSVNLSSLAINTAKEEITRFAGEKYVHVRQYTTKSKGAQEAHEAIRPTDLSHHTVEGTRQEKYLYELIWKRTIASQMADAEIEKTTVSIGISTTSEKFNATGEVLVFDGFLKVYMESNDDEDTNTNEDAKMLPPLRVNDELEYKRIISTERFSQRPPRYTEASLVRKLEELGIGRPSTYAPTISTIQNREYVEKGDRDGEKRAFNTLLLENGTITDKKNEEVFGTEKSKLFPTDIGTVVTDFLVEHFDAVLAYDFTAKVEKEFDIVASGKLKWQKAIDTFYKGFHPLVEESLQNSTKKVGERVLGDDPKTGKPISVKIGRYGAIAQIGLTSDEEKPKFAPLNKDQSIETITLEEALELFKLPQTIGQFEEKDLIVAIGRFGPYVKHASAFYSIPKDIDPLKITVVQALELIERKREADKNKVLKTFDEDASIQILNGRYGPYICQNKLNYKIPKTKTPAELTLDECLEIISTAPAPSKAKKTRKYPSKK
ncbi:MAG: type I DNA topoisomerase [Paludibacteraceae bacterium]|nr:type I DNA topoisomerase [Paludibacteraceae bacterium]MBP6283904.1 type I DNA topoisomerase [Paludibacteraceae bacterium]